MQRKQSVLIQIILRGLRSGQYKMQTAACRPGAKHRLKLKTVLITWAIRAVVGNTICSFSNANSNSNKNFSEFMGPLPTLKT